MLTWMQSSVRSNCAQRLAGYAIRTRAPGTLLERTLSAMQTLVVSTAKNQKRLTRETELASLFQVN